MKWVPLIIGSLILGALLALYGLAIYEEFNPPPPPTYVAPYQASGAISSTILSSLAFYLRYHV